MMPHAAVAEHGDGTHAAVAAHGDGTHAAVAAHPNALAEMRVTQPFTLNNVALKWIRDQNEKPRGFPTTSCVDLTETDPIQIGVIVKREGNGLQLQRGRDNAMVMATDVGRYESPIQPVECPEEEPNWQDFRKIRLYIVDRKTIWLHIDDVEWAVR